MIEIKNLCKRFGKLSVLKDVSLNLQGGQVVALIGPNGSGKTTLIKSILGLVIPDQGQIFIQDKNIKGQWEYRYGIGYMPQIGRYPEQLRISQLFDMMRDLRQRPQQTDDELFIQFKLDAIGNKRLGTLSGGTRQKVSAALAYLFDPNMVILDEPTAGLDPVASEILKQKIQKERSNGKLTLITSHNMSEVEELADSIVFLVDGQLRFFKSVEDIKNDTGQPRLGKALAILMEQRAYV